MNLISWNIQWCRGMDGKVDPARIARESMELCDPDVCCFQEVAINYDTLAGRSGEDQPVLLAQHFPGYGAHFAAVVDVPDGKGGRRQFGNMILSRPPVAPVGSVRREAAPKLARCLERRAPGQAARTDVLPL